MVTDGLSLDVTVNLAHFPFMKGGMFMGIVHRKEPSIMLQVIQVTAQVVVAIMATAQFVLKLVEYREHKKSNRPGQD